MESNTVTSLFHYKYGNNYQNKSTFVELSWGCEGAWVWVSFDQFLLEAVVCRGVRWCNTKFEIFFILNRYTLINTQRNSTENDWFIEESIYGYVIVERKANVSRIIRFNIWVGRKNEWDWRCNQQLLRGCMVFYYQNLFLCRKIRHDVWAIWGYCLFMSRNEIKQSFIIYEVEN